MSDLSRQVGDEYSRRRFDGPVGQRPRYRVVELCVDGAIDGLGAGELIGVEGSEQLVAVQESF